MSDPIFEKLLAAEMNMAGGAAPAEQSGKAQSAAPANTVFDSLMGIEQRKNQQFLGQINLAVEVNPDKYSADKQTAKYLNRPVAAVEALPEDSARDAKIKTLRDSTEDTPVLRQKYTDADFAKLAHDDYENLPKLEKLLRNLHITTAPGNTTSAPVASRQYSDADFQRLATDDYESLPRFEKWMRDAQPALRSVGQFGRSVAAGAQGMPADFVYGGARAITETAALALDPLTGTILPENPLRRVAAGFAGLQRDAQGLSKRIQGDISQLGFVEQAINQGGRSLGGNLVTLPLALAGGGVNAALAPMVGSEFARGYGEARDKGVGQLQALTFGASQAAIEYATEKIPMARLLGDLKAGSGIAKMLTHQVAAEIPGEQVATILQDLNEWAVLKPQATFADYLRERPSAAAQTLIATIVGVGGQVGTVKAIDSVVRRFTDQDQKALAAMKDAQALREVVDVAGASKLRSRDAQTFEQFVKEARADGPLQDVFIEANTLAQTLGENLQTVAQQVPALREQLGEALSTGGVVSIPVEQFAAYVPTQYAQELVQHLRTSEDAMSLAEADAFAKRAQWNMESEIDSLVRKNDEANHAAGLESVRSAVLDQIQQTGRFTPDVSGAYAELLTRFFEATAARSGTDVQQLFQAMGPRIVSQIGLTGGQLDQDVATYDQGDVPQTGNIDEFTGLPLNDDGTVTLYHHTSAEKAAAIKESGKLTSAGEPDVYVTTREQADTGYGDTVVRVRVKPELLQIDDEFSDGRVDYRINVGKPGGSLLGSFSQGRRGAYDPDSRTIALLAKADLSTFIHESAHYFLEIQSDLAAAENASPEIKADMQTTLDWFGVPDLATWRGMSLEQKRPYHEQFARGFEAYAFEGVAPSQVLQGVFQRFRGWLLRVYRAITALNVEITNEVRGVFNRMLATEQQIKDAEAARSYRPLFDSAAAAGMTEEEWSEYQASGAQATAEAVEGLQKRSLRDMQWLTNARGRALKKLQRDAAAKRKSVRAEVEAEVQQLPVYAVQRWLKTGMLPDGTQTVGAKLSGKALAEMYGDGPASPRRYLSTDMIDATDGLHPDAVAEMFVDENGAPAFDSGDAMVRAIVAAGKESDAIEALTDQRMLERYGDLTDAKTIERAADELIHNEARSKFLEREVNALGKAVGNVPVVTRAARQYAEEAIAKKKVTQIKPAQFSAAEGRAAKAAEQAFKNGDIQAAAARKREQLLQNQLSRVAHRAIGEIERAVAYLNKFDSDATRKAIGPEYADQIDALLERFDLRKSTSQKEIARRKSLAQWVEAQRALGLEPNIDERLLMEAGLQSYKDLTLEELRGLVDTVKNIEHLGRLKQKLLTVQDQRRFDEIVAEAAQSIEAHGGNAKPMELEGRKGVMPWLQGVMASHRKIASLARQMDGGQDGGPMWRILVRGMNDASNREQTMIEQATLKLAEIYAPVMALKGGLSGGKVLIPEIGASMTRGGRLAVALNWGNATNRQRLLDGDNWSSGAVAAIMGTLTPAELQVVNNVWEFIDSYWPQVEAKQLRVDGVVQDKVKAEPFTVTASDGTQVQMRGGYYPIKYDADRSSRAESLEAAEVAKDMMRGAFTRATTRRGHTKARAEIVKRPIRKDLDVVTEHVTQVVHDLSWHEWLMDANRVLSAKPIVEAIRTYYGPDTVRTLKDDLAGIATGDVVAQTNIDRALRLLRANVSRSVMGLSFTTALLQPFGLTQSMARIGVKPVLRGVARWAGDAARLENSMAWIGQKSEFMRLRAKTFNRELSEISARVGGRSATMQAVDGALFYLTTKMQMVADVPTWIGAYEKAIAGGADDSTAVALADQAVLDSQGGGQIKDLAEVQRKHPFLTQFYSYFSTTLNLVAEKTAATDFKDPKAAAGWLADMALLAVIPAIAPMLVLSLMRGDHDDDDAAGMAKKIAQAQAGYLLGMVVLARELSGMVSGYGYNGPPVARVVTDLGKATTQVSQGEIDEPAVMSVVRLLGTAFGIPTTQAIRSYKGWQAWSEGHAPATAILFGPPAEDK